MARRANEGTNLHTSWVGGHMYANKAWESQSEEGLGADNLAQLFI